MVCMSSMLSSPALISPLPLLIGPTLEALDDRGCTVDGEGDGTVEGALDCEGEGDQCITGLAGKAGAGEGELNVPGVEGSNRVSDMDSVCTSLPSSELSPSSETCSTYLPAMTCEGFATYLPLIQWGSMVNPSSSEGQSEGGDGKCTTAGVTVTAEE